MSVRLPSGTDPRRYAAALAVVALAYYLAGRIGLELAYLDGAVAALWPPAGLGLAVLFLYGIRLWPAIVIGDLLLGDYSAPLGTVLAQTVGNTLAVIVGALLLRRLTDGRGGLERVADVMAFVACAVVVALISAAFGPLSLRLGDVIPADELGRVFRTWTLGDCAGVLVVAPVILTWATAGVRGIHRRELAEGAVVLVLLVALAVAAAAAGGPLHRVPRAAVVGAPLRTARSLDGRPRRVLDHGLEHRAERRAVRARVAHGQPARDAAVHRHLGAHLAGARGGHRRAHGRGAGAGAQRGRPARARRRAGSTAQSGHPGGRRSRRRAVCSSR